MKQGQCVQPHSLVEADSELRAACENDSSLNYSCEKESGKKWWRSCALLSDDRRWLVVRKVRLRAAESLHSLPRVLEYSETHSKVQANSFE